MQESKNGTSLIVTEFSRSGIYLLYLLQRGRIDKSICTGGLFFINKRYWFDADRC
jgi:hypothetical protein